MANSGVPTVQRSTRLTRRTLPSDSVSNSFGMPSKSDFSTSSRSGTSMPIAAEIKIRQELSRGLSLADALGKYATSKAPMSVRRDKSPAP